MGYGLPPCQFCGGDLEKMVEVDYKRIGKTEKINIGHIRRDDDGEYKKNVCLECYIEREW